MKKFNFILAYDISNTKRLRQLAKLLEKNAMRIQNSLFYLEDTTKEHLSKLIIEIEDIIDSDEDDVRIYKVHLFNSLHLRSGVDLKQPAVIGGLV